MGLLDDSLDRSNNVPIGWNLDRIALMIFKGLSGIFIKIGPWINMVKKAPKVRLKVLGILFLRSHTNFTMVCLGLEDSK